MENAAIVAKTPDESLQDFNQRLIELCEMSPLPFTRADISVADGEPVVALVSDLRHPTLFGLPSC